MRQPYTGGGHQHCTDNFLQAVWTAFHTILVQACLGHLFSEEEEGWLRSLSLRLLKSIDKVGFLRLCDYSPGRYKLLQDRVRSSKIVGWAYLSGRDDAVGEILKRDPN